MTYEQKFFAIKSLDRDAAIMIRRPGDWYVFLRNTERKEGGCLSSGCGSGATPEDAVDVMWEWATDPKHHLVVNAMSDDRKEYRWNGFMWEAV